MIKDAALFADAVSETFEASDCADVIDGAWTTWPTREYFHV
jgi:hypothetical protein